jgi:hypothetical protein
MDFKGLTYEEVITLIIKELQKQSDFISLYNQFLTQCILNLNTVRWSPSLEYQITRILRDREIGTVEAHALLLHTEELKRPVEFWRKRVDMSGANILTNSTCKLREPRDAQWPECIDRVSHGVLIRTVHGSWISCNVSESSLESLPRTLISIEEQCEPADFSVASVFASIPPVQGDASSMCILALKDKEVSVGCLGDLKSFASFEHGVEGADFLESYLLPSDTIIVRVGKRNLLTGGLFFEDYFSFIRNGPRSILPCILDSKEASQVEEISKIDSDNSLAASCLTGYNDLSSAQSKVIWKQHELKLGSNLVLAVLGNPSSFFTVFYNGSVNQHVNGVIYAHYKTNVPFTHAILKF